MPTFDAPQSPIEAILQNMLGANNTLREPQSRNEALLLQILDAMQHGGGDVTAQAVLAALQDMDEEEAAAALDALGGVSRDEIGSVFTIRGSVATVADLPATGNAIGDVYYVEAVQAGYVWITSTTYPDGYWEELGEPIDLSAYELKPTTVTDLSSTSVTLAATANTIYKYGELASLTISSFPADGSFWVWFTSGATPTTTVGIANFVAEANKRYKITVEDGYATYDSWSIGGGA